MCTLSNEPRWLAWLMALALAPWLPAAFAAEPPPVAGVVVGGEVSVPLRLDQAALAKLPRHRVEASAHNTKGVWDGVALADVLRAAGAPMGDKLRGKNLSLYVLIKAADGYRVVFALAELDPALHDNEVLLADRHDGKPMDANEGPFRIIAVGDKRPARWIRQVTSIEVLGAPTE